MFTLYILTCPLDHKPFYVGITAKENPHGRLEEHIADEEENPKTRKIREILRAGLKPHMIYFDRCEDERTARDAEITWQNFLHAQGFTLTNGEIIKLNDKMAGKLTGKSYSSDDINKITAMHSEGKSIREIAEETQRSGGGVAKIIEKNSYLFRVSNCYEQRELLKARGYYWKKPYWENHVLKTKYQEEKEFLQENNLEYKTK